MDTCDTLVSTTRVLNEQIAQQLFDVLPEHGPMLILMDRDGHCRPSNPEELARLNLDQGLLNDLRAKVDDGAEPVVTQAGDTSLVAAQLLTDRTNCGYLIVVLAKHSPESTLTAIDLIETVLNQATLIARLVEKAGMAVRTRVACYRGDGVSTALLN